MMKDTSGKGSILLLRRIIIGVASFALTAILYAALCCILCQFGPARDFVVAFVIIAPSSLLLGSIAGGLLAKRFKETLYWPDVFVMSPGPCLIIVFYSFDILNGEYYDLPLYLGLAGISSLIAYATVKICIAIQGANIDEIDGAIPAKPTPVMFEKSSEEKAKKTPEKAAPQPRNVRKVIRGDSEENAGESSSK